MGNVETERLVRRLEFARNNLQYMAEVCEQKNDFRAIVREIVNVERQLTARGVRFVPVTNGRHLAMGTDLVRARS